jgi:hypothetical protein
MIWKRVSKWWISSNRYRISKSIVKDSNVYQGWYNSESLGAFHSADEAKLAADAHKKEQPDEASSES